MRDRRRPDGRARHCKECQRDTSKRWRSKNPDYYTHYREANRDELNAYHREWERLNAERKKEYGKKYREKHADHEREKIRRWRKENYEHYMSLVNNRRALELGAEGSYTAQEWQQLCERFDNRCVCCKEKTKLTVDHVVPLSLGGSNYIENLQPLCGPCNSSKGVGVIDYR